MILSKLTLKNFRRHLNSVVPLDPQLTLLVGENDAGKSSVLDAIKVLIGQAALTESDFHHEATELEIYGELPDGTARVVLSRRERCDGQVAVQTSRYLVYPAATVTALRTEVEEAQTLTDDLRALARRFDVTIRSNSRLDSVCASLLAKLDLLPGQRELRVEVSAFEDSNVYFLDAKHFENVEGFVREVYFRERQSAFWSEPLPGTGDAPETILEFVRNKLDAYATEIEGGLRDGGVTAKLQSYLPQLSGVRVLPQFNPRELNVTLGIRLVEGECEMDLSRFGDGTRRRVTLALLQHKVEADTEHALYVLDEPDAHLHVRAQYDLLEILEDIGRRGHQVVLTSHSPFLMNAVAMRRVRMLQRRERGTVVKQRLETTDALNDALAHLGIENAHLFLGRRLVIVEGHSEEAFLPAAYERLHNRAMSRDFIRVVRRPGIHDVPRFVQVLREFVGPEEVYVLTDNDADGKTATLLSNLALPTTNRFVVGVREFEDAFRPDLVHAAWVAHVQEAGYAPGPDWTLDAIQDLAQGPASDKYSKALRALNTRCKIEMTKPALSRALAKHCSKHELPERLLALLQLLGPDNAGSRASTASLS